MKLDSVTEQLSRLAGLVAEHPDPRHVHAALAQVDAAETAERAAGQASAVAHREAISARKAVERHDQVEAAARRAFDAAPRSGRRARAATG